MADSNPAQPQGMLNAVPVSDGLANHAESVADRPSERGQRMNKAATSHTQSANGLERIG